MTVAHYYYCKMTFIYIYTSRETRYLYKFFFYSTRSDRESHRDIDMGSHSIIIITQQ